MRNMLAIRSLLFSFILLVFSHAAFAQIGIGISVSFGPPALPVYEQPICPADGYLWTPGYWAYDDDLWLLLGAGHVGRSTAGRLPLAPGYWGWGGNAFFFHEGYWGPQVGFYGGISYGFGYGGVGYEGGRWEGGHFSYNTYVNHVNTTIIHNTYNTTVTNITVNHISYNGGTGGVVARPTPQQESFANEHHVGPVAAQTQHVQAARNNPELRASANHGVPPIAATAKPADSKQASLPPDKQAANTRLLQPMPRAAIRRLQGVKLAPTENRSEITSEVRANTNNHASELQPHTFTPPNTGNPASDKKYQQQQDKLAARQTQDHQKLQQQQEKEHQQAAKKNYNDAQKEQMEQRHTQQTQQVEQKHATQQHSSQNKATKRASNDYAASLPAVFLFSARPQDFHWASDGQFGQNCKAGVGSWFGGTEATDHKAEAALPSQSQESQDCLAPSRS